MARPMAAARPPRSAPALTDVFEEAGGRPRLLPLLPGLQLHQQGERGHGAAPVSGGPGGTQGGAGALAAGPRLRERAAREVQGSRRRRRDGALSSPCPAQGQPQDQPFPDGTAPRVKKSVALQPAAHPGVLPKLRIGCRFRFAQCVTALPFHVR